MAEQKTKKNDASVADFIASIKDAEKQKDARALLRLMERVTGEKPKMWGTSLVGFGEYHYRYPSGREGDWLLTGFAPRADNLSVYVTAGFGKLQPLLKKLGKHSTGASCLYVRRLEEIDRTVLEAIVRQGVAEAKALDQPKTKTKIGPAATGRVAKKRVVAKKTARTTTAPR